MPSLAQHANPPSGSPNATRARRLNSFRSFAAAWASFVLLVIVPPSLALAQPTPTTPTPTAALAAAASDPAARRTDREAAASELISRVSAEPAARQAVASLLASLDPREPGAEAVLSALARVPDAPEGLWRSIAMFALSAPPAQRPLVLGAVASFRTPDAALLLFRFTSEEEAPEVREAAFAGLTRLTGHAEFGTDPDQWSRWLIINSRLPERQWHAELIRGLSQQIALSARQARDATRRLVAVYRQLWIRTPVAERSKFLADLLRDDIDDLRSLAVELTRQELADSNALEPVVAETAISLLSTPRPAARIDGASLVNLLAPADGGPAVLEALRKEGDPRVAEALLQAAIRWPTPEARESALRWLESGGRAAPVAADLLWSLHRAGVMASGPDRARILQALRFMPPEAINGGGCRLLVALGDEVDRRRVTSFLQSDRVPLRLSAANALISRPDSLSQVLSGASQDPVLVEAAIRGVRTHIPNADGWLALEPLIAVGGDAVRDAQAQLAAGMTLADRLRVVQSLASDPERIDSLLSITPLQQARPAADAAAEQWSLFADLVCELGSARIALGHFPQAAEALALIPDEHVTERASNLLATSQILQGEFESAEPAPSAVWLSALDRCADESLIPQIAQWLYDNRRDSLTPEQAERIDALREVLAKGETSEPAPEQPPAPDDAPVGAPPAGSDGG
ncbi:MAG: hypothetical protein H6811_11670 [Phycisphaeraceae bacterium]|nr:hypothetical protein [Phycisphaeraceae bacterium]